jgi:dipeptidyl-peptidase-4
MKILSVSSTGRRVWLLVAVAAIVTADTALRGQQTLTPEWIASDAGQEYAETPRTAWRSDGWLWIYDARDPARPPTLEVLNPANGTRRPAGNLSGALAALNAELPSGAALKTLPWPEALDDAGQQGIYVLNGDVFVVKLETGDVTRVTNTSAQETSAGFSPDGRKVSFVRDHDLYVVDLATKAETRLTGDGSDHLLNGTLSWVYWEEIFGRRDIGYWWADDSRTLAFLQTDETAVTTSHFVDVAPIPPRVITQRYPVAGSANPKVRVGLVSIDRPDAMSWVRLEPASFEYVLRVQWLPGSNRIAVETMPRDQRRLDLSFADRSGAVTHILTETDPAWVNVTDDLYFLKDGRHFLWASERDGFMRMYRYALDGTLVNALTKGDWSIASNAGGVFWVRQSVAAVDEKNDWVYFIALEKSPVERHLYRVHTDGSGFARLSTLAGTHGVRFSPDAKYYVDRFSSSRTLPSVSIYAADGGLGRTIAPPRSELIAPFGVQYGEVSSIPASDGFPLPAQILKPAGFDATRRYPVVMYIYGGPSAPVVADNLPQFFLFDQLLLNEGYIVVNVDNRSATGISKRLEDTVYRRSGEPEAADLIEAARWLKTQPYVDGSRVGVWGWSGGATMTLNVMTRSSEFKAGIAVAPVTNWRYYDTKWTEALMATPAENAEGYEATSLVARAKELHGRLLLVHGTYDDNVQPQNEQAFINALVAKGTVFDAMIYPMRKHGISDPAAQTHLFKTMIDFWKRAL